MPLHFTDEEFAGRQVRATKAVADAGLDALLMFAPESQYWICGYDTFGFAMFQCLVLTASGDLHLLTRMPDLRQAGYTSTLSDDQIHIWPEFEGANPAIDLKNLLADLGVVHGRIGYESQTAGLTDFNGRLLRSALPELDDASDLIRNLRRLKSPLKLICIAGRRPCPTPRWMPQPPPHMPGRSKAIFWPPCKALFSKVAAIMQATNSLSVQARVPCCAGTFRGAAIWTRPIS